MRAESPFEMNSSSLKIEFDRLAEELRVVAPPDDFWAATGQTYLVEMLERSAEICKGLERLPTDFVKSLDTIRKLKIGR